MDLILFLLILALVGYLGYLLILVLRISTTLDAILITAIKTQNALGYPTPKPDRKDTK